MKLKVGLAIVSFVALAWWVSWEVSLIFLVNIFVHEQGHVWALKRIGHKTKGFYFLPLIGGVTLSEGKFTNRQKRIFVYMMGPVFGMFLALVMLLLYRWTDLLIFAFLSGTAAAINLFNLIPIKPLDGGYVYFDLVSEYNPRLAHYSHMGLLGLGMGAALHWQLWFIYIFLAWQLIVARPNLNEKMPAMPSVHRQIYVSLFVGSIVVLGWLCWYNYFELEPTIREAMQGQS